MDEHMNACSLSLFLSLIHTHLCIYTVQYVIIYTIIAESPCLESLFCLWSTVEWSLRNYMLIISPFSFCFSLSLPLFPSLQSDFPPGCCGVEWESVCMVQASQHALISSLKKKQGYGRSSKSQTVLEGHNIWAVVETYYEKNKNKHFDTFVLSIHNFAYGYMCVDSLLSYVQPEHRCLWVNEGG